MFKQKAFKTRIQKESLDLPSNRSFGPIYYAFDPKSANSSYRSNSIKTSKYSWATFLPMNILHQFSKAANIYFTVICIMQSINVISISQGFPASAPGLTIVILISMFKDFLEDHKRWASDREENESQTQALTMVDFVKMEWLKLKVGHIVKVQTDEYIPADLILLATSNQSTGLCFVETMSLDGETNLKQKEPPEALRKMIGMASLGQWLANKNITLNSENPNPVLFSFKGSLIVEQQKIPLNENNLLMRGTKLKNISWAIGIVCFTGHDTKIMMNNVKAKEKRSLLEIQMNLYIVVVFICLVMFCLVAAVLYIVWIQQWEKDLNYLDLKARNLVSQFFIRFCNWILIFSNFVPISLLVTVETVKFVQAIFMSKDYQMETVGPDGVPVGIVVQSSNLNEELGLIQYIFTDKTGTLTCNDMVFKRLLVGDVEYPKSGSSDFVDDSTPNFIMKSVAHVDFEDPFFFNKIPVDEDIQEILLLLSTCHSIMIYNNNYNASSPDELALVNFGKKCGYEFLGKDKHNNILVKVMGNDKCFKLRHLFEFNSDRKRMSVIVENPDGGIWLYCKGADSIIFKRSKGQIKNGSLEVFKDKLDTLAVEGYRTLVLSRRELARDELDQFEDDYDKALNSANNRDEMMAKCQDSIEVDLEIIGATAIEDKLQDGVPETINILREAGIAVWMLTGDKVETAITIGLSCNLIHEGMKLYQLLHTDKVNIKNQMVNNLQEIKANHNKAKIGLVVPGDTLVQISSDSMLLSIFSKLAIKCESVICCRVSPKQKQEIVAMVRQAIPDVQTLAIGDGANDVNMIVAAHVGVGIQGVEGKQATRAADYAIGEFKFLRNLLFVHGRECYRKNSMMILYSFWKNIVLVVPQFWYALVYSNFSGMTLYDSMLYQLVNVVYTSVPIIIFAVLDKELPYEVLLSKPYHYKHGLRRIHFNIQNFVMWFITGVTQAFLIAFQCSLIEYEPQQNGKYLGFWGYGIFVFICTQVVANAKILIICNSINVWIYMMTLISFGIFLASFFVINHVVNNYHYKLLNLMTNSPMFFIILISVTITCSYFDYLWHITQKIIFFKYLNLKVDLGKGQNNRKGNMNTIDMIKTFREIQAEEAPLDMAKFKDGDVNKSGLTESAEFSNKESYTLAPERKITESKTFHSGDKNKDESDMDIEVPLTIVRKRPSTMTRVMPIKTQQI